MKCNEPSKSKFQLHKSLINFVKKHYRIMLKSSKVDHKTTVETPGHACNYTTVVDRTPSTLNVSTTDYVLSLPVTCPASPAISNATLTPGRTRNIDQDMEALRISRQDNPFIQQVLASRESLDCLEESESDDTILMSQEFLTDLDADPLTLPEIHEHMIRSPPPTTWPKSPNFKAFRFPTSSDDENESVQKSPMRSRLSLGETATSSPPRPIPRPHSHHNTERFLLLNPASIRSLSDVRRISNAQEDSVQLMSSSDE